MRSLLHSQNKKARCSVLVSVSSLQRRWASSSTTEGTSAAPSSASSHISSSPVSSHFSPAMRWRENLFSSWQNGLVTALGGCFAIGGLAFLLWKPLKEDSVQQTAAMASEALGDVKVKEQAVQLSKEVVENVLRDPKSVDLVVRVVASLLQKEDTRLAVSSFIKSIFEDHFTKEITKKFVVDILDSKYIREHLDIVLYDLVMNLLQDPKMKVALSDFLLDATSDALRDRRLHATTGQAMRSAAYYILPFTGSPPSQPS